MKSIERKRKRYVKSDVPRNNTDRQEKIFGVDTNFHWKRAFDNS